MGWLQGGGGGKPGTHGTATVYASYRGQVRIPLLFDGSIAKLLLGLGLLSSVQVR